MNDKRRILLLTSILVAVCLSTATITLWVLYGNEIETHRRQLQVTAEGHATLIEAFIRHEADEAQLDLENLGFSDLVKATIDEIRQTREAFFEFSETGEIVLARRVNDSIVFVDTGQNSSQVKQLSILVDSKLAEPMRQAISGFSGTMVGLDYRGHRVIAAFVPVELLSLGLVAKIDLAEVRSAYMSLSLIALFESLLLAVFGAFLFNRINRQVIDKLNAHARTLRLEIGKRKQTEQILRRARANASRAEIVAGLGTWYLNTNTGNVEWSEYLCDLFGVVPNELSESVRAVLKFTHPADRKVVMDQFRHNRDEFVEFRTLTPHGNVRHFRGTWGVPVLDDDGITRIVGTVQDVTEQKKSENELQESAFWITESQRVAQLGHYVLDITSGLWTSSEILNTVFGLDDDYEKNIEGWLHLVHSDDKRMILDYFQDHVVGKANPFDKEYRIVRVDDGEERWVHGLGELTLDESGTPIRMLGTIQDITKRKNVEKTLAEAMWRLRFHIENTPLAAIEFNQEYQIINWSKNAEQLFGWSAEEVVGIPVTDLKWIHEDDQERVASMGADMLAGRSTNNIHLNRNYRKDGTVVSCEWHNSAMVDSNGALISVHSLVKDISERERLEKERFLIEKQIQQAQKLESLGVLAGGIAHDFNNLLMTILGNSDLALQDLSPLAPARGNIEAIESAARRAADLAQQMLAYSGKGQFVIDSFNVNEIVEEMSHLLHVSVSKSAKLKYNLANNLPPVVGDATQIRQVIMNLIINASEAIGDRGGIISISTGARVCSSQDLMAAALTPFGDDGDFREEDVYVYVEVTDTGCGMSEETAEMIFDPFFTTKFTGRGLGLAAARGIVMGHKGLITVASVPGKGSTFEILIPAGDPVENGAEGAIADSENEWKRQGVILLVDDEETIRVVGKQMLERFGFTVITAADGREGVDRFREHADEIACVLLDLTMPHMDGKEAFREMRGLRSDVRVILCSGYNEHDVTGEFTERGLSGFLQKPYQSRELRDRLEEVLSNHAEENG